MSLSFSTINNLLLWWCGVLNHLESGLLSHSTIINKPIKIWKIRCVVILSWNSLISFFSINAAKDLLILLILSPETNSWLHFRELGHSAWHMWLSAWLWSTDDGYSSNSDLVTVKLQNCFSKKLPGFTVNPNFTFKSGEIVHDSSIQNYNLKLHFKNGRAI